MGYCRTQKEIHGEAVTKKGTREMKLEQIRALHEAAKKKAKEAFEKAIETGMTKERMTEATEAGLEERIEMAKGLTLYINNEVLAAVGISMQSAPFIVGVLLSVADAVADGVSQGNEDMRHDLMKAGRDIADVLNEAREIITVKVPNKH